MTVRARLVNVEAAAEAAQKAPEDPEVAQNVHLAGYTSFPALQLLPKQYHFYESFDFDDCESQHMKRSMFISLLGAVECAQWLRAVER